MGYRQQDYGQTLGWGPDSIAADGCYLTSHADLLTWAGHPIDPPGLNEVFKSRGIFVDCGGGAVECLSDDALQTCYPDLWRLESVYHCESFPCDQNQLNNDDPNLYVEVLILGPNGLTHFVPITDWRNWMCDDTWSGQVMTVGQVGANFGWGGDSATLIGKVMHYRYLGAGGAGSPPPAVNNNTAFQGTIAPGGAHVRTLPGTDQPIVSQPGSNPDVVDAGNILTFDAWCHHAPKGGADVVVMDNGFNPPRADDRWFKVQGSGHWIASAGVNYNNGADPPSNLLVADPAAGPVVVPPVASTFTGTTWTGGVHKRDVPGGSDLGLLAGDTPETFDAWTRHQPPLNDAWTNQPDDRWFRLADQSGWLASAGVKGNPPSTMNPISDPASAPSVEVPVKVVPPIFNNVGVWETTTTNAPASNYSSLSSTGAAFVMIRAANGAADGQHSMMEQAWVDRSALAKKAGIVPIAWTFWYGPGDDGYSEPDPAAYLMRCADYTAGLNFDTPAWVIDFESRDATGLVAALVHLSAKTGKPVLLNPPGDPVQYGVKWNADIPNLDAAVAGWMPQIYTGAWSNITYEQAFAEWPVKAPMFPISDEADPARAVVWVASARKSGVTGISYWYAHDNNKSEIKTYVDTWKTTPPPPPPPPAPSGVKDAVALINQALDILNKL